MKYRNITLAAAVALTAAMLVTGCGAKSATVALLFVYLYYLSYHTFSFLVIEF